MGIFERVKKSQENLIINKHSESENFILMHKDIPLIEVNDKKGTVSVFKENKNFLPYPLRRGDINYIHFYQWAESRVILLDRENSKKILNATFLSQEDKYSVARACRLISVEDCFWIKESSNEKWNDFNLRQNPLSKTLSQIALSGTDVTLSGEITTTELTVQGAYAKCWERRDDGLYLLKKSKNNFESEKEVLASRILDALKIEHVAYDYHDFKTCECKCMADEDYSRLKFADYDKYCTLWDKDVYEILNERFNREFCQMTVFDYVTGNLDRHIGNWGFMVSNNTGEIESFHPLFDHNMAFQQVKENQNYLAAPDYRMEEIAREAQKEIKLDLQCIFDVEKSFYKEAHVSKQDILARVQKISPDKKYYMNDGINRITDNLTSKSEKIPEKKLKSLAEESIKKYSDTYSELSH